MFLSRLNPVSVFHSITGRLLGVFSKLFLSRLNPVSVFHTLNVQITPEDVRILVSIPPKSGLSFSHKIAAQRTHLTFQFLSRLNPVSVFHEYMELCDRLLA